MKWNGLFVCLSGVDDKNSFILKGQKTIPIRSSGPEKNIIFAHNRTVITKHKTTDQYERSTEQAGAHPFMEIF